MNINFFEGESRRFGIVFNQDYDVSRLSEVKLEIRARNTEIFLSFSESDGLTVDETGHVYIASIEPADTLYKVGEYKMQISFVDSEIGLRKSKIYDMSIMKSVVSAVTEATVSSDLIDFLVEINVNESVSFSENWDINIIATALSDTIEAAGIAEAQAAIATTKASEAAASASTATTKASEAAASASTATTKATEAAASASNLDNVTKSTFLYNIVTETANGESLNGASISTSNQTITIPTGIAGGSTYLQKRMVLANYPVWAVGHKIMFIVIINENIVNASDNILGVKVSALRNGSIVQNQGTNISYVRINSTKVKCLCEYTIQTGDTQIIPTIQINTSPATNAGANKVLTLAFYSQNSSLVYDTNEISNRFYSVEEKILSNTSNINSLQKNQEIYDFVGETATGESLNGATISALHQTITIPTGIAGGSTYLQKKMILANYPVWAVGHKIMFVFIINENIANASDNVLGVNVSAFRNGSIVQNQGLNISFARINSTKLKFWCEYTIQTGDTQIIPTIQINSNPAINTGATKVLTLAFYSQNSSLVYDTNEISNKLVNQYLDLQTKISANANLISNNSLVFIPNRSLVTGEALNGGVFVTNGISIPVGQTGNLSYRIFRYSNSGFSNFSDLIGKTVTFTVMLKTSADLINLKGIVSSINVTRTTGNVSNQGANKLNTVVNSELIKTTFSYTFTANDTSFDVYSQVTNTVTSSSVMSFEILNVFYTVDQIPSEYGTPNSYVLEKTLEPIRNSITSISAGGTIVQLIVKKDGTGQYLSPKLANDSITDASATKRYEIVVYPGVYTETEWIVKDYVIITGTNRETCWLKGELADNSTDAQISNTSTLWLKRNAQLRNLTITARNMRYPVHSEDSGGNANCEHQIYNCYIEHYGNAGARTWRNNNAGSGMLASTVWSSEHAWGYGSSSGLVEKFENTELISPVNGFYVHTNKDFLRPNINEFKNCSIVKKGNFGTAIVVQSLGSGMSDILSLTNSEISGGFIAQSDLPWISQDFSRQIANKAETKIFASGCSNFGYRDQTRGRTIRITSNSTGTLSSVSLTGNAVDVVVGFVNQVKGGGGVKGYVFGSLDVSGIQVGLNSNDTVNNTLGRRLGDCTSANRTLTVTFEDGTIKNIVFASNYTNTSNATIIAEINSALGSSGICDEYNPALEYYPEVLDKQITIQNNTTQGIARFSAVAYNSSKRYGRQMTTTDSAADFVGIALQQIAPGECGRVLVEGIIENIQLQSLTGTINYNSDISISSAVGGGFVVDSSKQIGKGVATNWFEFRGNK